MTPKSQPAQGHTSGERLLLETLIAVKGIGWKALGWYH
jgi:hypothetical protein